jgi:hypothetical protein
MICLRDRNTTKTLLAHVDALSTNIINIFDGFTPESTDLFIIGGMPESEFQLYNLLLQIKGRRFEITYANVFLCNKFGMYNQSFAINCLTGECYREIKNINDLPLTVNENSRTRFLKYTALTEGKLQKINIT